MVPDWRSLTWVNTLSGLDSIATRRIVVSQPCDSWRHRNQFCYAMEGDSLSHFTPSKPLHMQTLLNYSSLILKKGKNNHKQTSPYTNDFIQRRHIVFTLLKESQCRRSCIFQINNHPIHSIPGTVKQITEKPC